MNFIQLQKINFDRVAHAVVDENWRRIRRVKLGKVTVDLEHGVVDFDYVRLEPVVIMFVHALNPERDLH